MNQYLKSALTFFIVCSLFQTTFAQDDECINFGDGIEQGVYGKASNYMLGNTLFIDDGVMVSLDSFLYNNGTKDLLNVTFTDNPIFNVGDDDLLDDDYVFISNVNMIFDFDNLPENTTQVCFNFLDGGGEENISVNGQPIRTLLSLREIDGEEIAPGVRASIEYSNNFDFPAGTFCLKGNIETLLIGGQEFAMDDLCFYTEGINDDDCTNITDLTADVGDCHDDGTFDLKINFGIQNSNSTNFIVKYSGDILGPFEISQLPLVLTLRGDDTPHIEDIKVCLGNTDDGCCTEINFTLPNCGGSNDICALSNLTLDDLECISNTEYKVTIKFETQNPASTRFKLRTAAGFEGVYSYADLPLRLTLPIPTNSRTDEIKVIDSENADCYTSVEFRLPCLENCELGEGNVTDVECISDGRYRATINFRHNNRQGSFILKSRGGFEQTYSYGDLPIRIALPLTGQGFDEIKIQDKENPDCYTYIEFRIPCENTCQLGDIRLTNLECSADGKYFVTVNFQHNNRTGSFILKTRSGFEETYSYADLPIRFSSRLTNIGLDEIKIQDKENPDCTTSREFELDCANSDCNIDNLRVRPVDCSDDKFWLQVGFTAQDVGRSGYFIFVDGQLFGPFNYNNSQTATLVGPFENEDDNVYDILVLDIDDPSCYAYTELEEIDCEDDVCRISELELSVGDCKDDGTFELKINFRSTNNSDEGFEVRYGNRLIGQYRLSQLPVVVNLPAITTNTDPMAVIVVCLLDDDDDDDDNEACCKRAEFTVPDCQAQVDCSISNIRTEISDCTDNGAFFVKLTFDHENTGRGFRVFGNGERYGEFRYDALPIELGPFRGNGETRYEFIVQDLENENCKSEIVLEPVACQVEVWPGDANDNNRADHFDLLNIGIAFGTQGPPRTSQSIAWQAFNALMWNQSFENGTNFAHADANGDGLVDINDRDAIAQNYGLDNGNDVEPVPQLPGTDIDPAIFVDLPNNGNLPDGLAFSVPVILGTSDNFIEDIYGIAFTVNFDPTLIDPESIEISYPKSWLGEENVNLITFDRIDQDAGKIHVAITRTNQINVSGFGSVALISGIIDDIAGRGATGEIEVQGVYAIDNQRNRIPLQAPAQRFQIKSTDENVGRLDLKRSLRIIPNPSSDWIQVYTRYDVPIQSIEILDASGRPLSKPILNADRVSLADLPNGVYMLRIQLGEFTLHERVVKM